MFSFCPEKETEQERQKRGKSATPCRPSAEINVFAGVKAIELQRAGALKQPLDDGMKRGRNRSPPAWEINGAL